MGEGVVVGCTQCVDVDHALSSSHALSCSVAVGVKAYSGFVRNPARVGWDEGDWGGA